MEEELKEIGGLIKDDWQTILNVLAANTYRLDGVKQLAKIVTVIEDNLKNLGSTNPPMETLATENTTDQSQAEETAAPAEVAEETTPEEAPETAPSAEEQPAEEQVTPETPVDNSEATA